MNAKNYIAYDTCPMLCTEDDEGSAQTPNGSFSYLFKTCESELDLDWSEEVDPTVGVPSTKINASITFRKPKNNEVAVNRPNLYDDETQWQTTEESEEDSNPFEQASSQMTESDYLKLMERTWFLVKETKESRHKWLASPFILRQKLFDVLSRKSAPLSNDFLFEKSDLTKTTTIRSNSIPSLEATNLIFAKSLPSRRRRSTLKFTADSGETVTSFFSFLRK